MELPVNPEFLTRDKAAQYITEHFGLPCAKKTLEKWAVTGGGPKFVRCGARVLYSPRDIEVWIRGRTSAPLESTSTRPVEAKPQHTHAENQAVERRMRAN